jgi:hypothetical protein
MRTNRPRERLSSSDANRLETWHVRFSSPRSLLVLLSITAIGVLVPLPASADVDEATIGGRSCWSAPEATPVEDGEVAVTEVPTASGPEQVQVRSLGTKRHPVSVQTLIRLSEPLPRGIGQLNVLPGSFQRPDGWSLEPGHVVARADVSSRGRRDVVQLWMCFDPVIQDPADPGRTIEALPGSYSGSVLVDDLRVGSVSGTYTLNLQYPNTWLVGIFTVGCFAFAVYVGISLSTGADFTIARESRGRLVPAVAAAFLATLGVFVAQYLNNPSWEGALTNFIALGTACIAAAYGASNFTGTTNMMQRTEIASSGPPRGSGQP